MLPQEQAELEALVNTNEIDIVQAHTRSADFVHAIQVVFDDFSAVTFARDAVIGKVVEMSISAAYRKVKPIIDRFTKKGSKVQSVCIEKDFVTAEGKPYLIYVVTNAEHFEQLVQQLGSIPPEKLVPNKANDVVIVRLGKDFRPETRVQG